MADNILQAAQRWAPELDKKAIQAAVTGNFADNVLRAKFVGAKTVIIPELDMGGLATYNRDTGFVKGSLVVAGTPYTLSQDRGRTFSIDAQDEDETGVANLAGQVMSEFIRTKVAPEMDAYVLSKLGAHAIAEGTTVTVSSNKYCDAIVTAITAAHNAVGFDEDLICYINADTYAKLMNDAGLSKYIRVDEFKRGEITTRVKYINDVPIIPVTDARMYTAFNFLDGTTSGQEEGGFVPANTTALGFVVVPRRAVSLVRKTEKVRVFAPDVNQVADAYKFDFRIYYDCFIKNSMRGAVFAYTYTKA